MTLGGLFGGLNEEIYVKFLAQHKYSIVKRTNLCRLEWWPSSGWGTQF